MTFLLKHKPVRVLTYFILSVLLMSAAGAGNLTAATAVSAENQQVELSSGKSVVLKSDFPVKRVSVGNPEVADFILLSAKEIYLTGKAAGTTNLTLWRDGDVAAIFDVTVVYDTMGLKQQLRSLLPDENEIKVMASNDSITLAGKVTSAVALSQVLSLTRAFAPEGKVQNLVQVGGVHQVMLEVRIAEMSRTLTRRLGINFVGSDGDSFGVSLLGKLADVVVPDDATVIAPPLGFLQSPAVNSLFRFDTGSVTWTGFVDALKQDGLIKVLAEPTLIALSGQSANFLAGGEFPVPVPQGLGTVAIEYKPFGVGLVFSPTVLSDKKINLKVSPEVSDLDFSTAIQLQGFTVPGLRTRRTTTTIELGDGQSFAIAGLLRDNVRTVVSKFPLLGELPILGALFQSKQYQREETELIIIVTPHLVKPLDVAKQPLPTDNYTDPNDFEFYLMGAAEGRSKGQAPGVQGSLDGDFGHTVPKE
jgi:pilus assembly protein CpaC